MTFWEFLGAIVSAAGLFAAILGAFVTYAARKNGEATRALIRTMEERMTQHFTELFERMDARADERHREMDQRADDRHREMDQRADDRHREVIEIIRALKAT